MSNIKNSFKYLRTTHQFHLVDPSPWPLIASIGGLCLAIGAVSYMHKMIGSWGLFLIGFLIVFLVLYVWWRDIVREATFEQYHTVVVQRGLRLGMILFIVSEIMFFFAFFWSFFHSSLAPVFNIGGVWPPQAIIAVDTYTVPLTNTFILLASGATVTWSHHAIILGSKRHTLISLIYTLILASLFTYFQGVEYVSAPFNISDGIYGSCFYMATGFHGFHVFVGTIALLVSLARIVLGQQTDTHHFGFESAIWYWHFVGATVRLLFLIAFIRILCLRITI